MTQEMLLKWAVQAGIALAILLIGIVLIKICQWLVTRSLTRLRVDPILVDFLSTITRILLLLVILLMALEQLGVNTTSAMAVLGAAGLAVGLALQKSLSNFAAGIMLIVTRPFALDHSVDVAGINGKVRKIRLFSTLLQTADNRSILVPNSRILEREIINYSAYPTRRIDLIVDVSYDNDLRQAKQALQTVADAEEALIDFPAPAIEVFALAASSVQLSFKVWAPTNDFGAVKARLLENIKLTFDQAGLTIPYPQQEIHLSK